MVDATQKFIDLIDGRKLWPPVHNYTFFGQGSAFNTKKYFGDYYPDLPPLHFIIIAKEGDSLEMLPADSLEYCSRYIFTSYLNSEKEVKNRFRHFDETESHIASLYEKYSSKKVSETSVSELLSVLDNMRDEIWGLNGSIYFIVYFDKEICFDVLRAVNSSISRERLDEIWERARHPAVESFEKAQQRSVLQTIAENRTREQKVENARFIYSNYFGVETLERVAEKIDSEYGAFTSKQAYLKLMELDGELENKKSRLDEWTEALSKDEQNLVWYIQRIIEYRDRRKNLFAKAYVIWWLIYEKLMIEARIDHSFITYIQFDEMMRGVEYLRSHRAEIEARKNGAVLLIEYDGTVTLQPIDYYKAKQQLTKFYIQSNTIDRNEAEIRGQPGSPGKTRGKVCVILNASKVENFEDGCILVAGMTRPEFVPLMKRASAIITDEGGITCHAAIVAREMMKPCIIGTKIATQVLHDGDLVEVDADHGVVRIVKKAGNIASEPTTVPNKNGDIQKYKKEDYSLVFWARGVSVFVTDIHLDVYRELEVLYLIDRGMFKQYFTKSAYARALDRGLEFYSDNDAVDAYQKDLSTHCDIFKGFFETQIKDKNTLTREGVSTFFTYAKKLCGDYGKMNIEYTDKAFAHKSKNPTIEKNLTKLTLFKDQVRAVMNMVLFEPGGYLTILFDTLGKQFDVSRSVLDDLTQREVLALFENKRPDELSVRKRQTAFVESYDVDGFYEGEKAEQIIRDFRDETTHTDSLKGTIANTGKITGRVKIIPVDYSDLARVNTEIEKMEQGEILVAETTAPELMVACKKAGAIITDMGGLMSHAAIVSREFGIPCIVGTKIVTQVLHDGDLVEVDADHGVVRILDRGGK